MNNKVRNLILFGILMVVVLGFTLTPLFGKELLWRPENNQTVPFSGIHFDTPTNVSNLKIRRSEKDGLVSDLISYDVEFEYRGADSSMRIIGKLGEQSFFGETITPRHSKATLKGEYDKINDILFNERLNYRDLYKNLDQYKFDSTSEIRVPLSESIKDYKFTISYEPKTLTYSLDNEIAKTSVFLTNARVDNFTDGEYVNKSETQSFNESGMYVNVIEVFDEGTINKMNFWNNVNNVVFILSVIVVLGLIWFEKAKSPYFVIVAMLISVLTVYRFLEIGVSPLATVTAFPLMGILTVVIGRLMSRNNIVFNKYDFTQSIVGALILLVFGLLLYVLPIVI